MALKYVGAYLLAVLAGKEHPTAKDIQKILESVESEYDESIASTGTLTFFLRLSVVHFSTMQKKKIFDIEGSNIEMLGSAVEKECREAAGKGEKAWKKAGKKVGIEIWRIEQFKVVAWPKNSYGKFYEGDSYIVLNTWEEKETKKLKWDLHFWLGKTTSQDEAGTAAYKTVELDDFLGGGPIQYREVCGRETGLFVSYFEHGVELLQGGADSGFNHVEPENYEPRLLHLKGRKNVRVTQVELSCSSLCSGDCFVLDAGLQIYQWQGKGANFKEKTKACQYARSLDSERSGKAEITVIDQGDKDVPPEFWDMLGGKKTDKIREDDGGDEQWEKETEKRMFQLSDAGGKLEFVSVGTGKHVTTKKLDTNDVFIVDIGSTIYVWIGKGASTGEKAKAMSSAQKYLREYKRPAFLPIVRILEGSENNVFMTILQPKVSRKLKKSTGGPTVDQSGAMGCYLTASDSSNGSLFLNWSETSVEKSLAYFKPTKSVPKFKFKSKGGKSEHTRNTASNRKNFYEGWCNYIKMAKEYKSTFSYKCMEVRIYELTGSKLSMVPRGKLTDLSKITTIAAIPGTSTIFEGLKTVDKGTFLNKAQAVGAALTLPK